MTWKNAEQKAVIIPFYGYENILKSLKKKKILDTCEKKSGVTGKKIKYQVIDFDAGDRVVGRVVRVECHTTHKVTVLGVPKEKSTETCIGAIAWTFNMTAEEYAALEIET